MPISCPPMDGTVDDADPVIAQGILKFLVENDMTLMEVIESLVICKKVEGLDAQVKLTLYEMRDEYLNVLSSPRILQKPKKTVPGGSIPAVRSRVRKK